MQGLAGYNDDSPPSSPARKPSSPRRKGQTLDLENNHLSDPRSITSPSSVEHNTIKGKGKAILKDRRSGQPPPERFSPSAAQAMASAGTSTAGPSRLPSPQRAGPNDTGSASMNDPFEGMSEEEIFKLVTRPDEIEGVTDWGIPPEVDPAEASDALKAKVQQFLRLKYEKGQHINTTLLSSSSFANPHIYSKLVEFVDIDERATAFSSGGWTTRRSIEDLIPDYGPQALSATQKAKQEAVKRSQEVGKRSNISFALGRRRDGDERGGQKKRSREDEIRDRERDRDRDRYRSKDRRYEGDRRDRDGRDRR